MSPDDVLERAFPLAECVDPKLQIEQTTIHTAGDNEQYAAAFMYYCGQVD